MQDLAASRRPVDAAEAPGADIAEASLEADPFGRSRGFADAPRALVVLLIVVVATRLLLGLLTPGPLIFPLLQVALLAFIAWKAVSGAQGAAVVFGVLLLMSAATTSYQLIATPRVPAMNLVVFGAWVALLLATAAFIFFHPQVRRFYAERARAASRGPA